MCALAAATKQPVCARMTFSAVWRSRADLPDMFGPVIIIICVPYKVLAEGLNYGKHPSPRSIVTAHYTGWTINGKKVVRQ